MHSDHIPVPQYKPKNWEERRSNFSLNIPKIQLNSWLRLVCCVLLFLAFLVLPSPTQAVPPLPSSLYGAVRLNDADIPDGTRIEALIKDKVVAFTQSLTYQGDSVYALDIPGDDLSTALVEGGVDGDVITFKIGGILADQSGTWRSATNLKLDLSASTTSTPLPPQVSPTLSPTQTPTSALFSIQAPQADQPQALNQPAATRQPEMPVEAVTATPSATFLPEPTPSKILTEPLQVGKANTGQAQGNPSLAPPAEVDPVEPQQAAIPQDPPPSRGISPLIWFTIVAILLALTLLGAWVYRTTR